MCEEMDLIDDWNELNNFIIKNGDAGRLRSGTYTIRSDMSFGEIADIITKRKQ